MTAYTRRRLIASAKLGLAAAPFAVLLRLIHGDGSWMGGVLLGFSFGAMVGLLELFVLRGRGTRMSFLPHLALKSVLFMTLAYGVFAVLNLLDVLIDGISWTAYAEALTSRSTMVGLLEGLAIITVLLFAMQLDRLVGPGVLLKMVTGRYHRPRREERIFMFLDLKGSTGIAEHMEVERYLAFLRRYFAEMSEPILETNAEIYQYVGDEVVLTWEMRRGLEEANCVRAFFLIDAQLERSRESFMEAFGVAPEFKAGLHAGEVVTAQIGDLKHEVIYSGAVLNTTARMEALCNQLGHRLLVSRDVVSHIHLGSGYEIEPLGVMPLRGKESEVELFTIRPLDKTAASVVRTSPIERI
ncbi:MAG: adenylate/guanylate cyclase domain-containing protein [Longimicrobiales bacterium]